MLSGRWRGAGGRLDILLLLCYARSRPPCSLLSFVVSSVASSPRKSPPRPSSWVVVSPCVRASGFTHRTCFVQSSGSGAGLGPLVNFYSKLPKGPAPTTAGGIKARFFNGKNASAAPLLAGILGIFGLGYTIDYQSAFVSF